MERRVKSLKSKGGSGDITTVSTKIKDYKNTMKIIREYDVFYTNKLDNLDEMDKFLEAQNLLRLYHEEIDNLNKPVTSKEIESVI